MWASRRASTWSSVSSLWNRLRAKADVETVNKTIASSSSAVPVPASPWQSVSSTSVSTAQSPLPPLRSFWLRSALFRCSAQKLNMLGRQISGLNVNEALLQMRFSPKKAAERIHQVLHQGRTRILHETAKAQHDSILKVWRVQQVTVGKGPYLKRIDIKARGRHGVIWRPHSFVRLQLALPEEDKLLQRRFRVKVQREERSPYIRLDY